MYRPHINTNACNNECDKRVISVITGQLVIIMYRHKIIGLTIQCVQE